MKEPANLLLSAVLLSVLYVVFDVPAVIIAAIGSLLVYKAVRDLVLPEMVTAERLRDEVGALSIKSQELHRVRMQLHEQLYHFCAIKKTVSEISYVSHRFSTLPLPLETQIYDAEDCILSNSSKLYAHIQIFRSAKSYEQPAIVNTLLEKNDHLISDLQDLLYECASIRTHFDDRDVTCFTNSLREMNSSLD